MDTRLQKYDIDPRYQPEKEIFLAIALSCVQLLDFEDSNFKFDMINTLDAEPGTLNILWEEMQKDQLQRALQAYIKEGWAAKKSEVKRYYEFFQN